MEFLLVTGGTLLLAGSGWIVWGLQEVVRTRSHERLQRERLREQGLLARQRLELASRQLDDEVYRDFTRRWVQPVRDRSDGPQPG